MRKKNQITIPTKTVIETRPPVVFASRLALREGNAKKPIYRMHKWWAERLGSVFRSLLISATTRQSWIFSNSFYKNTIFLVCSIGRLRRRRVS